MADKYASLRLENQLCFPLYACSKEVVRRYTPLLNELGLTYTQYITMMVLWEREHVTVKELGEALYLDSGTLTPLLKKLESKGYIERHRCEDDERSLMVSLTEEGRQLREKALEVPQKISCCLKISKEERIELYKLLYKVLDGVKEEAWRQTGMSLE